MTVSKNLNINVFNVKNLVVFTLFFFCIIDASSKDTLRAEHLKPLVTHFKIDNHTFNQSGLDFFTQQAKENQYIIIGEYHGSARISEFTQTFIPVFNEAGCKNFALEVGPESAKMLEQLSDEPNLTTEKLRRFNGKYHIIDEDFPFTAIPFFEHKEDAAFLAEASRNDWNLIGIDQEFVFGYIPLIEEMYQNLPAEEQRRLASLKNACIDSLEVYFQRDIEGTGSVSRFVKHSIEIDSFLSVAAIVEVNKPIEEAIRMTTEIYYAGANRQYLRQNSQRILHMKDNLRKGMIEAGFDLSSDKLLLKIGAFHAGRGWSPLSLYELGNTLSELAEFHGNQSLNIYFYPRFYEEDGKVVDDLDPNSSLAILQHFGKKDQWTVIDFRPIKETIFYFRKYVVNDYLKDVVKRFDLMVLPPVDFDPTINIEGM